MVADNRGIWTDLFEKAATCAERSRVTCYGWQASGPPAMSSMVEAAGRRFCNCNGGLYEIDAAGRTLRTWWTGGFFYPAGRGPDDNDSPAIIAPADCPISDGALVELHAVGSRLVMAAGSHLWFAVYDLPSDTWYGPLDEFWCAVVTPSGGLWRGGSDGLRYLSLDDVMAYAEATGRAMTTAQYRQRREQFIAAAKPLDRGKFALAMRQFDRAKAALQEVLQAEPDQPEALRLMGFLYDANCLNQPDEAMKYYRRLAAVEGDPERHVQRHEAVPGDVYCAGAMAGRRGAQPGDPRTVSRSLRMGPEVRRRLSRPEPPEARPTTEGEGSMKDARGGRRLVAGVLSALWLAACCAAAAQETEPASPPPKPPLLKPARWQQLDACYKDLFIDGSGRAWYYTFRNWYPHPQWAYLACPEFPDKPIQMPGANVPLGFDGPNRFWDIGKFGLCCTNVQRDTFFQRRPVKGLPERPTVPRREARPALRPDDV